MIVDIWLCLVFLVVWGLFVPACELPQLHRLSCPKAHGILVPWLGIKPAHSPCPWSSPVKERAPKAPKHPLQWKIADSQGRGEDQRRWPTCVKALSSPAHSRCFTLCCLPSPHLSSLLLPPAAQICSERHLKHLTLLWSGPGCPLSPPALPFLSLPSSPPPHQSCIWPQPLPSSLLCSTAPPRCPRTET